MLTRLKTKLLRRAFRSLSFDEAIPLARYLMRQQGFGAGGSLAASGEEGVFRLVSGPAPVLFDVGGHVGEYTRAFKRAYPAAHVYIFEPSKAHFRALESNLADLADVTALPFGLGADNATLPLYKHAEISGLASLAQRRLEHFNLRMDQVEEVQIRRLDDVMAELDLPTIDLLKLDVEGFELQVLRGALQTLRSGKVKLVQFEFGGTHLDTHTNFQDFFYFFKDLSMTIGLVQPSGAIQFLPTYKEIYEFYTATNYLAVPNAIVGAL